MQVRTFTPEDRPAGFQLRVLAFTPMASIAYDPDDEYVPDDRRIGVFDDDGTLLAQAGAWPFGQWFLGRRVPTAGIGGVTVLPEARGRGLGRRAMEALVEVCRDQGDVFSSLYPSLPGFYRSLGWVEAGGRTVRRLRTAGLADLPRPDRAVRVRALDAEDDAQLDAAAAAVDRTNRRGHGTLDRGRVFHRRLLAPDDELLQYVALRGDAVVGYLSADKTRARDEDGHVSFRLLVTDLVADDHDAWLALWSLVASNAPVCTITDVVSRPHEPLLDLLPTATVDPRLEHLVWQGRILDVGGALAARGWPTGVEVEVPLHVDDDWLPANDGPGTLHVTGGEARWEPGGPGRVHLDVGALTALFTGWATPTDLAWQGRLTGATPADLDALTEAFRAPTPWLDAYF